MDEVSRIESLANGSGLSARKISARILSGVAAAALVLALALLPGCGGGTEATPESGGLVRGLVVSVEGRTIIELESLSIRDEAGKIWTFTAGASFVGFTPSHLREHQLLGHPVVVTYAVDGDTLAAVEIAD